MAVVGEAQLRLLYSLLKPAVRAAARFHVPMRTVAELVRLAYFEELRREGLGQVEIARRLGQSDRNVRSLATRLKGDFFAAEQSVGLVREIENIAAALRPHAQDMGKHLPGVDAGEIDRALSVLTAEGRIERTDDGRLQAPPRYHILSSDQFHNRIDALNHFLDVMYRSVIHRLVFDDRESSMIKAISFTAVPRSLHAFVARFEGELRRGIATLEEEAQFQGEKEGRYTLGVTVAPIDDEH